MSAALAVLWLLVPAAGKDARFDAAARAAYLDASVQAVREAKPAVLDQGHAYAAALERGACSSDHERLRADCLITAARRFCRTGGKAEGKRCPLFMDVIASNVLAERELISTAERYEMMRRHKDHRGEMNRRLGRIYGSLAVELRLSAGPSPRALGTAIDRYCLATADVSSLSWQTCAAALVWFIGRGG